MVSVMSSASFAFSDQIVDANTPTRPRLIVGITGASGVVYGVRLLGMLKQLGVESHLVLSKSAQVTLGHESELTVAQVKAMADYSYTVTDIGARIASGSFRTLGMVVAPCSIRTLSEIASGVTAGLVSRAADVVLKERRRLVLMPRESPLHAGHCELLLKACQLGAIIAPPMPALYNNPQTIDDIINHSVGRVLDLFDIDAGIVKRWEGVRKST